MTEKVKLDFPMFDISSIESPQQQLLAQQPLNQTLLEGTIFSPNRPITYEFNGKIRKRKTQKQALENERNVKKQLKNTQKLETPDSTTI